MGTYSTHYVHPFALSMWWLKFDTDYIQKRRGEPGLFSFEYNLLPKILGLVKIHMYQIRSTYVCH